MELEIAKAVAHSGYTMREYNELPGIRAFIDPLIHAESKSDVLARYRVEMLIEAVQQDIMISESIRKR